MSIYSKPAELTLKPIRNNTGRGYYCGPAVIASITGAAISKVEEAIRKGRRMAGRSVRSQYTAATGHRRRYQIRGTGTHEVRRAFVCWGIYMNPLLIHDRPADRATPFVTSLRDPAGYGLKVKWPGAGKWTLAKFLDMRTDRLRKETLIVEVTGHWIAVRGGQFVDTKSGGPCHIQDAPGRRAKVQAVHILH